MATAQVMRPGPAGQPDIGYAPDLQNYLARVARRKETEHLATELPSGFPKELTGDLVWDGKDVAEHGDFNYRLTSSDIDDIEAGLAHFKALGKSLGFVGQDTFPLSGRLHAQLRQVSHEIHHGRGFKVLQGLPFDKHSREDNIIIYAGVASHIAPIRGRQDHQLEGKPADVVMNHIKDMSAVVDASKIGAPAYTTEKQVFHTDAGDVIALACLETAAEGGESKLASSGFVYNILARTRPDLIKTLAEPWAAENFSGQGKQFSLRPLLHYTPTKDGTPERMIIQYARRTFTGYWGLPRSANIPAITEAQAEALDALHFLAEKHATSLDFQKGDVQFANNLSIFHARDAFKDTPEQQRHLVRLWLRDPENAWETPEALKQRWDHVYGGVTPENSIFPLEPRIRSSSAGKS